MPPYQEAHDFVMTQRTEQYKDLHDAIVSMGRAAASTPPPQLHLRMFLVQEAMLPFEDSKIVRSLTMLCIKYKNCV